MPAALALPAFWGAVTGVAGGSAAIYGANKMSDASEQSAQVSSKANADAIAEQQRQDAIQKQEFDQQQAQAKAQWDAEQATTKAQWDAQQQIRAPYRQAGAAALSNLGGILGVDFGSGGAGGGGGSAASPSGPPASGPMPSGIDWTASPDQLGQSLTNYFQKAGKPATEVPYWVSKASELVARGKEIGDPNYANKRLAAADIFGGGGTSSASGVSVMAPGALAPPAVAPMGMPNALNPSYSQVVPITSLMGAAR